MKAIGKFLREEPAMVVAVIIAALGLFINVTDDTKTLVYNVVQAVVVLLGGAVVRQSVTPTVTVEAQMKVAAKDAATVQAAQEAIAPTLVPGSNPIQAFLVAAAQSAVSALKLPAALSAIAPMLLEFAQSEVVLTDDLRANLQLRVLQALRAAGVSGVDV